MMRERDHRRVHAPLSSRMERSCARGVEDACMIMHECGRRTRQLCSNASLTSRGVGRRFSQCSCVPSFLHAPTSVSPRGRMASHIPSFCRCALLAWRRAHMQHAAMPPRRAPARRCVLRALTRRARTTSSCHGLRFERGGDGEGGVQTRKMLLVCDWARGARRAAACTSHRRGGGLFGGSKKLYGLSTQQMGHIPSDVRYSRAIYIWYPLRSAT